MTQFKHSTLVCAAALALGWGCSSSDEGNESGATTTPGALATVDADGEPIAPGAEPGSAAGPATPGTVVVVPPAGATPLEGEEIIGVGETAAEPAPPMECASSSTATSLVGLVLAFTFDVSGSMGSHSQPYFAREYKWDPVVAATKAFFADTTSAGVSATLTFFPNDLAPLTGGGGGNRLDACNAADYDQPDVGLTPLPSDAFASAIDAITPPGDGDWRQGTPTGPALEGTIATIEQMRATDPNAKYVIVLVTDGEPAECSNEQNNINFVSGVAASVADEIPTYVIGVGNPMVDGADNPPQGGIDNLHQIAQAGGTDQAFLIDTNDPVQTAADFQAVIDSIRDNSFSCALEIPQPPAGQEFDSTKVNVNYTNAMGMTPLTYDPSCSEEFGWYYDDEENPSVIQMCDSVCTAIQNDATEQGQLNVEFGCLTRIGGAK